MVTRSNVRLGLTGAILLIILGAFSGCDVTPTELDNSDNSSECEVIGGVRHCPT